MQHDTRSHRPTLTRSPNGVWRIVQGPFPSGGQAPPPPGGADRTTPARLAASGRPARA